MKMKFLPLILLLIICVNLFAGCNNTADKSQLPTTQKVTNVYKTDVVSIPNNIMLSSNSIVMGDRIYVIGVEVIDEETFEIQNYLCSFDFDGGNLEQKPINLDDVSFITYFAVTSDGSLILLSDSLNVETQESVTLISKYTADGAKIFSIDPTTLFADTNISDGGSIMGMAAMYGVYIRNFTIDNDDNIYIPNENTIAVLSPDGDKLFDINAKDARISNISKTTEGKVFVSANDNNTYSETLRYVDFDTKSLGDPLVIPQANNNNMGGGRAMRSFSMGGSNVFLGSGYDMYLKESNGLYGYNYESEEKTLLCDWINSDINANMITDVTIISPDKLIYTAMDEFAGSTRVNILTHIPDDEVKEKYLINIATLYDDNTLTTAIINYNRANEEYRMVIRDYSQYNTDDDYSLAQKQLDMDIVNGNLPDIVLLTPDMPIASYINKNMFTDLYEYFDKDSDISRDVLLNCVKAPFEYDGKLYQLFTSFSLETLAGKTANVGAETNWTVEQVLDVIKAMPEGKSFTDHDTRHTLSTILLKKGLDSFIDYDAGTCDFNSQQFIDVLNYLITLDKDETEVSSDGFAYRADQYNKLRDDEAYITTANISSFTEYLQLKFQFDFADITLKGYPTLTGDGTVINGDSYAISAKSQLKDGAWEFLKYLISDELQTSQRFIMSWPSTVNGLKYAGSEEMKRTYNFDTAGGFRSSFGNGMTTVAIVGGVDMSGGMQEGKDATLTQEDVDNMTAFLNSDFSKVNYNEELFGIIYEELMIFFDGQKSAEETAKVIQSRAAIYISENS